MASEGLHEPEERLTAATRDMHRAVVSLMEELEAIDWYQQRVDATEDTELREILGHNRDEEMEHASLLLEWIRRRNPSFDARLRPRLFVEGPIVQHEQSLEGGGASGAEGNGSRSGKPTVTLGSLREDR
jgi:uncharacterized protein